MIQVLTGHQSVDAIAAISFEGDITPRSWYQHICYQTLQGQSKCDRLAVDILADIIYWYRPYQAREELTGEVLGWRKKFLGDILRRSPEAFAESLNTTVRCVRESIRVLEELGLIKVVLKPVYTQYGVIPNVMHIDICPEAIALITYRISRLNSEQNPETTEKSLLTKWVTSSYEISNNQLRNQQQAATKSVTTSYEISNSSIYRDFIEINTEISHNAPLVSPPVPPTQIRVCENSELVLTTEQIELEEPTPQQPASLLKNPVELHQTDNLDCRQNIPSASFEKAEESNKQAKKQKFQSIEDLINQVLLDPGVMASDALPTVYKSEIKMRGWRFPWRTPSRDKIYQTCDRSLVEMIARERAKWSGCEWTEKIPTVIKSIGNLEASKGGLEELLGYWSKIDSLNQTQKSASTNELIGYYSNRSLEWHKAIFSELLDGADEVGNNKAIANFSTRYDLETTGATIHWLNWMEANHPQIYAHLHKIAA